MSAAASRVQRASQVRPSARQLAWQARELYGFIHFGMATMTDREWAVGHESPDLFDPAEVDADVWVESLAAAGMTAVILTAKHHDGFCLWPSALTSHTVAASPWRGGRGDLVAEVAHACRRRGLAFGVYLSPWDRTEPTYGTGTAYDDFFVAQLTELLTGYGEVSCVWFDGACGEGADGRRQVYDWERYHRLVRELQPSAVISVCGPDVRWCGNEAGHARADEWSVVPRALQDAERVAAASQQSDDAAFARLVRSDDQDLGSRAAIEAGEDDLVWYPAEVNTSIRPGWFHHPAEDDAVKGADELFDVYRRSVGGNATMLLNVPPDRDGRIGPTDRRVLAELGDRVRGLGERDTVAAAALSSGGRPLPGRPTPQDPWRPPTRTTASGERSTGSLHVDWPHDVLLDAVVLREDIAHGQQVEGVVLTGRTPEGTTVRLGYAPSVGYQRIVDVPPTALRSLTVTVTASRGLVRVSHLGLPGGPVTGRWSG